MVTVKKSCCFSDKTINRFQEVYSNIVPVFLHLRVNSAGVQRE